jgi:hypothetical protein
MNGIVRIAMRVSMVSFIVGVMATVVPAYDLRTHEALSRAAVAQSGIAATLDSRYGVSTEDRFRGPLHISLFSEPRTPEGWIVQGARDEDHLLRPVNHFWNPLTDAPLTVRGIELGNRAPDWALEDRTGFTSQRYSYRDAKEAFATALTASDPAARERAWGHTFYALGHVIHLLQDMAQPQHTRNDQHVHIGSYKSLMEKYVEDNIGGFGLTGAVVPTAARSRDLWARGPQEGLPQGMASFSNGSFLSAGTNFTGLGAGATAPGLPSPALNLADRRPSTSADRCKDGTAIPDGNSLPLIFYGNTLTDPVTGSPLHNPRMTTHSLFDQYLQARARELTFTLNCFNLDSAADILLPRAASYSAALLQYFFRGFVGVSYENQNQSLRISGGPETMAGDFELLYARPDGTRARLANWTLQVHPEQQSASLSTPWLPPDAEQGVPCWLIFRGQLGLEQEAVVGGQVGCPVEPPPPPPPPGQWYVYFCATFVSELDYVYATTSPPLWEGGPNDPALIFHYSQESTGTGFSCFLVHRQRQEPPPNSRTEHPV